MAEYLLLGAALGGTATFARSRGVPWVPVVMATLGGWVPILWISSWAARSPGDWAMALEFAWAWLAFVTAGSWFVSGRTGKIFPTWPWPCGVCGYVNSRGVVECESCGRSWRKPPP